MRESSTPTPSFPFAQTIALTADECGHAQALSEQSNTYDLRDGPVAFEKVVEQCLVVDGVRLRKPPGACADGEFTGFTLDII